MSAPEVERAIQTVRADIDRQRAGEGRIYEATGIILAELDRLLADNDLLRQKLAIAWGEQGAPAEPVLGIDPRD